MYANGQSERANFQKRLGRKGGNETIGKDAARRGEKVKRPNPPAGADKEKKATGDLEDEKKNSASEKN